MAASNLEEQFEQKHIFFLALSLPAEIELKVSRAKNCCRQNDSTKRNTLILTCELRTPTFHRRTRVIPRGSLDNQASSNLLRSVKFVENLMIISHFMPSEVFHHTGARGGTPVGLTLVAPCHPKLVVINSRLYIESCNQCMWVSYTQGDTHPVSW
jgi:hypothetical protein